MMIPRLLMAGCLVTIACSVGNATDLIAHPESIQLHGNFDRVQVVTESQIAASQSASDVTRKARYEVTDSNVATIDEYVDPIGRSN